MALVRIVNKPRICAKTYAERIVAYLEDQEPHENFYIKQDFPYSFKRDTVTEVCKVYKRVENWFDSKVVTVEDAALCEIGGNLTATSQNHGVPQLVLEHLVYGLEKAKQRIPT